MPMHEKSQVGFGQAFCQLVVLFHQRIHNDLDGFQVLQHHRAMFSSCSRSQRNGMPGIGRQIGVRPLPFVVMFGLRATSDKQNRENPKTCPSNEHVPTCVSCSRHTLRHSEHLSIESSCYCDQDRLFPPPTNLSHILVEGSNHRWARTHCTMSCAPSAPDCRATSRPPRSNITVGIL